MVIGVVNEVCRLRIVGVVEVLFDTCLLFNV